MPFDGYRIEQLSLLCLVWSVVGWTGELTVGTDSGGCLTSAWTAEGMLKHWAEYFQITLSYSDSGMSSPLNWTASPSYRLICHQGTVFPGLKVLGFSALPGFRALKAVDWIHFQQQVPPLRGAWDVRETEVGSEVSGRHSRKPVGQSCWRDGGSNRKKTGTNGPIYETETIELINVCLGYFY